LVNQVLQTWFFSVATANKVINVLAFRWGAVILFAGLLWPCNKSELNGRPSAIVIPERPPITDNVSSPLDSAGQTGLTGYAHSRVTEMRVRLC
jgi:hypothetical protein